MPIQLESRAVYPAASGVKSSTFKWMLIALPFAWLWLHLILNLKMDWAASAPYNYGFIVPLLTAVLLLRRWHRFTTIPAPSDELKIPFLPAAVVLFLAFLYLPTRLIEEAVREWRTTGLLLAIETIGLTLYAVFLLKGWKAVRELAFPICFFFTAVPWPTLFEFPFIQGLSQANATFAADVLGILGVPAIGQGHAIQISTGWVQIDDGSVRAIQSTLMISLFLGEFYFVSWTRRVLLVLGGFILAMFFNVCRISCLTYLAAKNGIASITQYHDEAGNMIFLASTVVLWGASYLLSRRPIHSLSKIEAPHAHARSESDGQRLHALEILATSLIIWVLLSEIGITLWYSISESKIQPGPQWSLVLPENNSTFRPLPFTPEEHTLLRFDDGRQGQWEEADGTLFRAFYFDWLPGRVAGYLAKRHTPDICLPASDVKMTAGPTLMMLNIHNLVLPMRAYVFESPSGPWWVYQCHWEPGLEKTGYVNESSRFNLIRGVWAGRGVKGQKVIEIVISRCNDAATAKAELVSELQKMIKLGS